MQGKIKEPKVSQLKTMEDQKIENNGLSELTEIEFDRRKNPFWKLLALVLLFVFTIWALGFYQFLPSFFLRLIGQENLTQGQLKDEKKGSILDIFASKALTVDDFAPDFVSKDAYENRVYLSDFQGKKPVLLIFWATWCGFCAKELPDLKAFTREYQNKIQVIAVASGESKETIQDYIQEKSVNFLILLDKDRKIWNQYFIRGTPSHFLIDKSGKIVALRPGLSSKENLEIMLTMMR